MPNNEEQHNLNEENNKTIIEIPQEYYDKIDEERSKSVVNPEPVIDPNEVAKANKNLSKLAILILINTIGIFALVYLTLNVKEILIIGIPLFIIVLSIIMAITNKKDSLEPQATLISGMIVAVICFVVSMLKEDQMDLWTHYAIYGAVIAFVGFISSNLITNTLSDLKNIKAVPMLGVIIYFVALFGIPYFIYNKYPETFYKYVFLKQAEIKAETEEEFIIKTLKNRYDIDFVCHNDNIKYQVDQNNRRSNVRKCYDPNNKALGEFTVTSTIYNLTENQYMIQDDYLDLALLQKYTTKLGSDIAQVTTATRINPYLFPVNNNCNLIGNCVECDEYFENYKDIDSFDNQYQESKSLNLSKYIKSGSAASLVEDYKFKYVFTISGIFNDTNINTVVNNILNKLNTAGYKNYSGVYIAFYDNSQEGNIIKAYEVRVSGSDDLQFKNPDIKKMTTK